MKRFLIFFACLLLTAVSLPAQPGKRLYLFPEFTVGHFELYNHSTVDVKMNFDAAGQKVYYYDGETLMEMTDLRMVKTLTVGGRVFVVRDGLLCERFENASGPVLVNWQFKSVNKGSKGAMGITTQGKVDVVSSMNFGYGSFEPTNKGRREEADIHSVEVWDQKNENTYFLTFGGVDYKVKTLKDLCRAFPDKAEDLKAFAKSNHLMMSKAEDAFRLIDYLHSLIDQ